MEKILIADTSGEFADLPLQKAAKEHFEFVFASSGTECLAKLAFLQPKLVILDLMLPGMHGIELLNKIRSTPATASTGVIIIASQPMVQTYHAAIKLGANYFLKKPSSCDTLIALCHRWFAGTLTADPFNSDDLSKLEGGHCYIPKMYPSDNYLRFWGTRGSSAVSGPDYVHFGGNTCCLEVRAGDELIIIDAGTGIRSLGKKLLHSHARTIHLFLGHTHWDHITGFPFFSPIYDSNTRICIWSPVGFEKSTREMFTEILAYAYFPVRLEDIRARIEFHDLRDGQVMTIGDISVSTHYAFHPGPTLCFKIRVGNKTFGYVTDNEVLMGYHGHPNAIEKQHHLLKPYLSLIEFLRGVDCLIHEAQYSPFEYQDKVGWGHSSISNASVLVRHCEAKEWIVTHHDPKHTDQELQNKLQLHRDIVEDCRIECQVRMAYDGLILPLDPLRH